MGRSCGQVISVFESIVKAFHTLIEDCYEFLQFSNRMLVENNLHKSNMNMWTSSGYT